MTVVPLDCTIGWAKWTVYLQGFVLKGVEFITSFDS